MKAYPKTSGQRCKALLLGGALLLGMALSTLAWADGPQVKAYRKTYGEWSARWWQWVRSIPAGTNPLLDTTGHTVTRDNWPLVTAMSGSWPAP
jgi:hypothetical protein